MGVHQTHESLVGGELSHLPAKPLNPAGTQSPPSQALSLLLPSSSRETVLLHRNLSLSVASWSNGKTEKPPAFKLPSFGTDTCCKAQRMLTADFYVQGSGNAQGCKRGGQTLTL